MDENEFIRFEIACGICHGDVHAKDGPMVQSWPRVVGHEIIGRIAKLGEGVDTDYFKPGQKVGVGFVVLFCFFCLSSYSMFQMEWRSLLSMHQL